MSMIAKEDREIGKRSIVRWVIAILTILLYACFYLIDGAVEGVDTQGYVNMVISREAGYSLWVNFFLMLFGENRYADVLVICQLVFAAVTTYVFTFSIAKIYRVSTFSVFVIWGLQVLFLLLCRFGSGLGAIYPSTVLTEGLTYSLYFLYVKTILQLNEKISVKRTVELLVYCALMMLVRTQLAVAFLGVIAFFFFKALWKQMPWKKWLLLLAGSVAGIFIVLTMGKLYSYAVHGVTNGTVGSNSFVMVSGLYGADETDASLFSSDEDRQIFLDLYEQCRQKGLLYSSSGNEELFCHANHYSQSFDEIKFSTVMAYLRQYYEKQGVTDPVELVIRMDEKEKELGWPLLCDNIAVKVKVTLEDFGRSLMRTIGKAAGILVPYTIVAYVLYIILMICGFRKGGAKTAAWGGLFVLIMILGNIMATSFMIFGEPRYLLYNMIPFYVMGYLMLREVWIARKEKKK